MSRSIQYTSSPLLASRTPVWRSKFVVAMIALGFTGLGARAAYIQIFNNDFFQRQGVVRFARTIELPANRGRVLDRNGLILASSVPAASIWAIPEDVDLTPAQSQQLAKLLDMRVSDLGKKLADEMTCRRPNTRLLEFPGTGHHVHDSDRPAFLRAVGDFMATLK